MVLCSECLCISVNLDDRVTYSSAPYVTKLTHYGTTNKQCVIFSELVLRPEMRPDRHRSCRTVFLQYLFLSELTCSSVHEVFLWSPHP